MKYKVLIAYSCQDLSEQVERYVNRWEWKLQGGIEVSASDHRITYYQAIVKED